MFKCFCIFLCLSMCFLQIVALNYTESYYTSRVVNGWRATQGDAPYQVALKILVARRKRLYGTYCGAVIVGPKKLITAAHCVQSKKAGINGSLKPTGYVDTRRLRAIYAVAGNLVNREVFSRTDSVVKGQWRSLYNAYYPRKYMFPMHDIALAYTRTPFHFNEYVAPITVASMNVEYLGPCLVSGYGRIDATVKASHLILAYLDIIPASACSKVHQRNMDSFVCSSSKVSDVAQGDTGGPLVCFYTNDPEEGKLGLLVGIVSGHRPHVGSFFTRISKYKNFIDKSNSNTAHNNYISQVNLITTLIYGFLFLF